MGFWSSAGKTTSSITKSSLKGSGTILSRIGFKGGITLIMVLVIFLHSITTGIVNYKESGKISDLIVPPLWEVGGRIVSADEYIYQTIQTLEDNPNELIREDTGTITNMLGRVWDKIYLFFDVFSNIWFLFIIFRVYYWIITKINNNLEGFIGGLFALITMMAIQLLFSSILLTAQIINGDQEAFMASLKGSGIINIVTEIVQRIYPFKGIVNLIFYTPALLDGIMNKFSGEIPGLPNTTQTVEVTPEVITY